MHRQGPRYALALLGTLLGSGAHADFPAAMKEFNAGHYEAARSEFLVLAELGDVASQFNLGTMAMQGQGGPKDLPTAVGWLTAAAENGSQRLTPEKLADMRSKLTDEQRRIADDIVSRYGRDGLLKSVLPVPEFREHCKDLTPPRVLQAPPGHYPSDARYAHQNGFVIVQLTIGIDGVARDPEVLMSVPGAEFSAAAVEQWLHARFEPAEQGGLPVEAKETVKTAFNMEGGGVLWDVGALKRIRETALTGDPGAQYQIGLAAMLDPSLGIPRTQAHALLVSAAQGGQRQAQYWAANRFMSAGRCSAVSKKLTWLRAAAAAGEGAAQLALATDLLSGQHSAEQVAEARSLLEQAAQADSFYVRKHVTALMAASPLEQIRDPATALAVANKLSKDPIQSDPQMFEALAAADAVNGKFSSAGTKQWTAVKRAKELHWNTSLMEERLESYRNSKPWVGDLFSLPPVQGGSSGPAAKARLGRDF
ncbi:MAG: TonB family protein [Gammaproteobacteria bacterium]|nr:MAG: TonB family protein [Gammaproteobacteria bacterium]